MIVGIFGSCHVSSLLQCLSFSSFCLDFAHRYWWSDSIILIASNHQSWLLWLTHRAALIMIVALGDEFRAWEAQGFRLRNLDTTPTMVPNSNGRDQKKTSRTSNDLPNLDKAPLQPLVRVSPPDLVFPNIYRDCLRTEVSTIAPTKGPSTVHSSEVRWFRLD